MSTLTSPERGIYCNRTLNFRSIRAVGYDMDYTLIHYREKEWEERAYQALKERFQAQGWPVEGLKFDPDMVARGLIIDTKLGNLLKANRFGFVKRAMHGTKPLSFDEQSQVYSRTIVDLSDKRWVFLNTYFSLSEGCMYAQLVDLLDQRRIPVGAGAPADAPEVMGYEALYQRVRDTLDFAHMEGKLKAEIISHPERFVDLDPETPLALLDQYHSGKKLLLITNSEWSFTGAMMSYSFDRFLPEGITWRDLFEIVIVGARKPQFFTTRSPFFEVVTEEGLLRPHIGGLKRGVAYLGGSAVEVEHHLGLTGDEIIYVGDHMFGDVHVTKSVLRWRTGLILRELESEIRAVEDFRPTEQELTALMMQKEELEAEAAGIRLGLQRLRKPYGPVGTESEADLEARLNATRAAIDGLDKRISPLVEQASKLNNPIWGLFMRTGNDKSYLAFQMERYADIYTSRVSNFLSMTPFSYLRSPRGTLPHDLE